MSDNNKNIIDGSHLTDNQMSIAAEAMLSDKYDLLEKEISFHIEACSDCKANLYTLVDMLSQMNEESSPKHELTVEPKDHKSPIPMWTKWLAVASVFLIAITSTFYWQKLNEYKSEISYLQESLNQTGNNITGTEDSLNAVIEMNQSIYKSTIKDYTDSLNDLIQNLKSKSNLLAEAFKENKSFEDQIGMTLRSTPIAINTPNHIEQVYGKQVKINWKMEGSVPMSIAIYNNKGFMVLKDKDLYNSYTFESKSLLPGVYYWKLIGNEGVVFIGKISLK